MRIVLTLGLVAILLQLLVPPMRIVGSNVSEGAVSGYAYHPIWWEPDPKGITWVHTGAGEKIAFGAVAEIDAARLAIPVGITVVVTALGVLLVPRKRRG